MGILSDFTRRVRINKKDSKGIIDNKNDESISEEYKEYLSSLEKNRIDIENSLRHIEMYKKDLEQLEKNGEPKDSARYRCSVEQLIKCQYAYYKDSLARQFIRPNNQADLDERIRVFSSFGEELLNIVGEKSQLRFHGTSIYFANEIIKDRKISPLVDRIEGYTASTDLPGEISASVITDVNRSLKNYIDIDSFRNNLPCGVLFVLNEKNGDQELRSSDEMQSVDFGSMPEQLVGILCTSEVKDMVSKWCLTSNVDANKVFTYDGFLEYAKNSALQKTAELPIISEEKTR